MRSAILSLAVQVSLAVASPIALPIPQLIGRQPVVDRPFNASLPNITIFATGGTIAGSAASSDQTTGYQAGALGVDLLLKAVPQLYNVSNPKGVQFANVGSSEVTPSMLVNLTQHIQRELDSPLCQGVVVTHGTDTLEETGFFLDLTVNSSKPVVMVGAMRPATAISADGPINLLEAVTLAASPAAKGRGVLVALNDRIGSAWYTTKSNANMLDTFKAVEQGFLGFFLNIKPFFYFQPSLPIGKHYFNISTAALDALPQVDVLFGHQGLDPALAGAAVASGAKGLVLAGMGAGSWTKNGTEAVADIVEKNGTAVVYSRRSMDGSAGRSSRKGTYGSGTLNPQKARIMLQLAINAGYDDEQMRALFEYEEE